MSDTVAVTIRGYERSDEDAVLGLLSTALGGGPFGGRSRDAFRWKHERGPFGPSFALVAERSGEIVGFRSFMRWRFGTREGTVHAVRAVDTATLPSMQGRGIFSRLTTEAVGALPSDVRLIFNTPNEKSLPGYLKMGWSHVGEIPIWLVVRRPVAFALRARSARSGTVPPPDALPTDPGEGGIQRMVADPARVADLLARSEPWEGLRTPRSVAYLRWRYAEPSALGYRCVTLEAGGELGGLAVFRTRPRGRLREATVSELIVPRADRAAAASLIRAVAKTSGADHLALSFPRGSAASAGMPRRRIRAPGGMTLVARALADDLPVDPLRRESWALSLGDVEVF